MHTLPERSGTNLHHTSSDLMEVFPSDLFSFSPSLTCRSRDKPFSCRSPPLCFRSSHLPCVMISASSIPPSPSNHIPFAFRPSMPLPRRIAVRCLARDRTSGTSPTLDDGSTNQEDASQGLLCLGPSSFTPPPSVARGTCRLRDTEMEYGNARCRGAQRPEAWQSRFVTGILLVSRSWKFPSVQTSSLDFLPPGVGSLPSFSKTSFSS